MTYQRHRPTAQFDLLRILGRDGSWKAWVYFGINVSADEVIIIQGRVAVGSETIEILNFKAYKMVYVLS